MYPEVPNKKAALFRGLWIAERIRDQTGRNCISLKKKKLVTAAKDKYFTAGM